MGDKPTVAINAAGICKIEKFLRLSRRIERVIGIVRTNCYHILLAQLIGNIENNGQIASIMSGTQFSIDPNPGFPHDSFKIDK